VEPSTTPLGININAWIKNATPFLVQKRSQFRGRTDCFCIRAGLKNDPRIITQNHEILDSKPVTIAFQKIKIRGWAVSGWQIRAVRKHEQELGDLCLSLTTRGWLSISRHHGYQTALKQKSTLGYQRGTKPTWLALPDMVKCRTGWLCFALESNSVSQGPKRNVYNCTEANIYVWTRTTMGWNGCFEIGSAAGLDRGLLHHCVGSPGVSPLTCPWE
jgi:hypothetical protein